MSPSLVLLIPAYNAADTLGELVDRCRRVAPELPVVIVNDGSGDATSRILAKLDVFILLKS